MNYDYSKRGYLLPEGCKDLIDVWKLEAQKKALEQQQMPKPIAPLPPIAGELVMIAPLPLTVGEVVIPDRTTLLQLAKLLNQKPFRIIADLMELGVFANVNDSLFENYGGVRRLFCAWDGEPLEPV